MGGSFAALATTRTLFTVEEEEEEEAPNWKRLITLIGGSGLGVFQ